MATLESLTRGASVSGIVPDCLVTVVDVRWIGSDAVELTYKTAQGAPANVLIFRDRESSIEVVTAGAAWSFTGDGSLFRLVSEAHRILLAHLFDPLLAVNTSLVDPLPHQITAVYGEMLSRQPLRYLLADDPGAGKTIMTGLYVKELIARGDVERCMIVCPGSLAEQWQDELHSRFQLPFDILTNDALESARSNWFEERDLVICRLDKLSRNEDLQEKLDRSDWDLIVCDEAHKLSATYFGSEIKYTKRYRLAQRLSGLTRHFLLLTATPHNGKEADFQLFMALLDGDRFEGRFRDGVHVVDTKDLMRRLVKEELLKFDGTPLFPERRANTVTYQLSQDEADLYERVTNYVREEFNRADALENEGRKGTVGFALTILQRRLASSPEAIYQSIKRRRERLEKRLREEELLKRAVPINNFSADLAGMFDDDIDDFDDAPSAELEMQEERIVDQATAARNLEELRTEILMLKDLEAHALRLRQSGNDRKWEELSRLLQNNPEMFDGHNHRRKLVIFTEHRDTLNYLVTRIGGLLGKPEAVVTIHGGIGREDRRKAEQLFTQDPDVEILVATDAAGEGINLQRAHLMVNYDLPWNPNRLEQRFGRIHRIGQTEVCHLWNLVARETREGEVYLRLLEKLETEREALGGQVFDVLGRVTFDDKPLRNLLLEAIRYSDQPEVKARLFEVVDRAMDRQRLRDLIEERALAHDSMDVSRVREIREDMERATARRLQPHFIAGFFKEAFNRIGGGMHEREAARYQINNVPAVIRARDRQIGHGAPVLQRYERVTFHKDLINVPGKPHAAFLSPGHPLLSSVLDLTIERHRDLLRQGAILVDDLDEGTEPRVLVYLKHAIRDGRVNRDGSHRVISQRMQFVEILADGTTRSAGHAPYLDYRPLNEQELAHRDKLPIPEWVRSELEQRAEAHAIAHIVPDHLTEVRKHKLELLDRTEVAVKQRLSLEISHWDDRAIKLREQELAGKTPKLNSALAKQRADELQTRLTKRLADIALERKIDPLAPIVLGAALIIPRGAIRQLVGAATDPVDPPPPGGSPPFSPADKSVSEARAMEAVMETERRLGFEPRDVSADKVGYDIESKVPDTGYLRFIEVKGRAAVAATITVTRTEILTALNKPDDYILAIVELDDSDKVRVHYVRQPFQTEPDFGATSVNYNMRDLLARSEDPS